MCLVHSAHGFEPRNAVWRVRDTKDFLNFLNFDVSASEAKSEVYFNQLARLLEINKGKDLNKWNFVPVEEFLMTEE